MIILCLLVKSIVVCAQNTNDIVIQHHKSMPISDYYIHGKIVDKNSGELLHGLFEVYALDLDSAELWRQGTSDSHFDLGVPGSGKYIIKCVSKDYNTAYKQVEVKFKRRESNYDIGVVEMEHNNKLSETILDEVVVKATKLKFYFDKDTLVYDAPSFTTQSGLILSEILNKMPGLEVHEDGEIFSNGKKVDELRLNGKDFFNRDRKTILRNLPAFMIRDVRVYENKNESEKLMSRKTQLIMDVRLKKQYEHFSLGNAGFGYGTNERFRGQLFGLTYTPNNRISSYVLSNNINKNESYVNGNLQSQDSNGGDKTLTKGGINYNLDNPRGYYNFAGDVRTSYKDGHLDRQNTTIPLLGKGNYYKTAVDSNNQYDYSLSTSHNLKFMGQRNLLTVAPVLSYNHRTDYLSTLSGMMENTEYGEDEVLNEDSIIYSLQSRIHQNKFLYSSDNAKKKESLDLKAQFDLSYDIQMPHSNDILSFGLNGSITEKNDKLHEHNFIELNDDNSHSVNNVHHYGNNKNTNRGLMLNVSYK